MKLCSELQGFKNPACKFTSQSKVSQGAGHCFFSHLSHQLPRKTFPCSTTQVQLSKTAGSWAVTLSSAFAHSNGYETRKEQK
jgi:hypothetical protein